MLDELLLVRLWCPWCFDVTWHTFIPWDSFTCIGCRAQGRETRQVATPAPPADPTSLDSGFISARRGKQP